LGIPLLLGAFHAQAQPHDTDAIIDNARKQIEEVRKNLSEQTDDAKLLEQRVLVLKIQSKVEAAAETLAPELASLVARLTEIGKPSAEGKEAPDIAMRRAQLEKSRNALDRQMKLARLLAIEATQTAEQITALRRSQFQARLGERRRTCQGSGRHGEFWWLRCWARVRAALTQSARLAPAPTL
jgi:small-conductance mechanosensitive channel